MDLEQYVKVRYNGQTDWFIEELNNMDNVTSVALKNKSIK